MQIQSITNSSKIQSPASPKTDFQVDETKFIAQGDLPDSVYNPTSEAQVVFKPTTPNDAWQQYAFGTTGNMIEVSSTIPAGYQDVNSQLKEIFTAHGIDVPDQLTISYGIPDKDQETAIDELQSEEPQFLVKSEDHLPLAEQIEALLNSSDNAHFKQSYLALDRLTAAENSTQAERRDSLFDQANSGNKPRNDGSLISYGYKQDFSMSFDGNDWQMNSSIKLVELMRVEKAPR